MSKIKLPYELGDYKFRGFDNLTDYINYLHEFRKHIIKEIEGNTVSGSKNPIIIFNGAINSISEHDKILITKSIGLSYQELVYQLSDYEGMEYISHIIITSKI